MYIAAYSELFNLNYRKFELDALLYKFFFMIGKKFFLVFVATVLFWNNSFSCTTAIISGKATPDGRPLLWKHRDTDQYNNKVMFFVGAQYDYIGIVNSQDTQFHIWGGTNSAGFSIMNSASYNIIPENDKSAVKDLEGYIMKLALANCSTIKDFANMLDTLPKPWGISANFGIIDAQGGAGYYEANNFFYKFFDANDPLDAPNGYLVRTNFSISGKENEGAGYNRYQTAQNIINEALAQNGLTPAFFLHNASLCLRHDLTKTDLSNEFNKDNFSNRMYPFRDFIVRYSSSSTIVVQGIKGDESPLLTTSWVKIGFQPASVAVPVWVGKSDIVPTVLTSIGQDNSLLCDITLKLKEECFPYIKWSEGENYVLLEKLGNINGTGLMQLTVPFDLEIMARAEKIVEKWRKSKFNDKDVRRFNEELDRQIPIFYSINFGLTQ